MISPHTNLSRQHLRREKRMMNILEKKEKEYGKRQGWQNRLGLNIGLI